MGLRNGTHVPKVGFAAAKWGLGCEMEVWEPWVISQRISQLRNRGMGCEMITSHVPRGCFSWSGYGAAKWFRGEGPISQQGNL
uniref:Uncharacterized protein n=1 Tax=Vitis vinifera TaxID=29760 RepID=A5BUU1_VITVI|nr:hypothetical protein VITISV_009559 [Vitis vinifera]